jgi:hypothetical protein
MVARLEAYRHGRKLSACVRELLDHALTCPPQRQREARAVTDTDTDTNTNTPQAPARRRKRQAAPAD